MAGTDSVMWIPWCYIGFLNPLCPPLLPAMSSHSASDGKENSWEAGLCEDYLCYWLTPAKFPHPVLKGTNLYLPHDLLLYTFL